MLGSLEHMPYLRKRCGRHLVWVRAPRDRRNHLSEAIGKRGSYRLCIGESELKAIPQKNVFGRSPSLLPSLYAPAMLGDFTVTDADWPRCRFLLIVALIVPFDSFESTAAIRADE